MIARLTLCEMGKLLHSKMLLILLGAATLMTLLTLLSPVDYPGGPMFMTAGESPDKVGGAIGFIGNLIDPQNVAGSAMRTALLYTPFWLPIVIVFSVSVLAADFASGSLVVSKAKGVSLSSLLIAKVLVIASTLSIVYGLSGIVSFAFKTAQYGIMPTFADYRLFFGILVVNILLLISLVMESVLLFTVVRNSFLSALLLIFLQIYVLIGYPSAYGMTGEGADGNLVFPLVPVFYLMNICSLSFENVSLILASCYAVISSLLMFPLAVFAFHAREVRDDV